MAVTGPKNTPTLTEEAYDFYDQHGFCREEASFLSKLLDCNEEQKSRLELHTSVRLHDFKAAKAEFEKMKTNKMPQIMTTPAPRKPGQSSYLPSLPQKPLTPTPLFLSFESPLPNRTSQKGISASLESTTPTASVSAEPIIYLTFTSIQPPPKKTPFPTIAPPNKPVPSNRPK